MCSVMSESASSSAMDGCGWEAVEPNGSPEDEPMAIDCQDSSSRGEMPNPVSMPPHPPDMRSIIRRLRRQDLQLHFSHPPPDSPPSDGEASLASSAMACKDKYQEGHQTTEGSASDASSCALFPTWIKQQNLQIDLDAGQMSSSKGIVEYTVRSANLTPTWCTTTSASSTHGGPITTANGSGVLAADTCEPELEVTSATDPLLEKFSLTGGLVAELPAGGLQAMMIHAKLRASLPRLASGVNRRDLVRFHLSDEVAQHCSSRVLNRVYKPVRTRVRGKAPAQKSATKASGLDKAASAARPTPSTK